MNQTLHIACIPHTETPSLRRSSAFHIPLSTSNNSAGFTLIEIMVAILLVLAASTMTYVTFAAVTKAWRNGSKLSEDLHHGDFVMDQLVMGLRSAYFPDAQGQVATYGFWLTDNGSGSSAEDIISWVKQGTALTESNSVTVSGPHRVQFSIEKNDDGVPSAAVRYWRPFALPDDFDSTKVPPEFISSRVRGFNCRVATNTSDNTWEWSDVWEKDDTNRLPRAVELTLYLEPIAPDRPPVVITRCIEIPVWRLSWGGGGPPAGQFRNPTLLMRGIDGRPPATLNGRPTALKKAPVPPRPVGLPGPGK